MKGPSLLLSLVPLLLLGCGGSDATETSTPARVSITRDAVAKLLRTGIRHSGAATGGHGTRSKSKVRPRDGGLSYNEVLGVWVEPATNGEAYWTDANKTASAGFHHTTSTASGVIPSVVTDEQSILAGPLQRTYSLVQTTTNADGSGSSTGRGTSPDGTAFSYQGTFAADLSSTYNGRTDNSDGTWETYQNATHADGTTALHLSSNAGVDFDLQFGTDLAGSGSIKGNADGLPATVAWDGDGNGQIVWSDGQSTAVNVFTDVS